LTVPIRTERHADVFVVILNSPPVKALGGGCAVALGCHYRVAAAGNHRSTGAVFARRMVRSAASQVAIA
jgi:hypothetical protein